MPERTEAQKKAQKKYIQKFSRIEIRVDEQKRNLMQDHAKSRNESVNSFINRAIDETIIKDKGSEKQSINDIEITITVPKKAKDRIMDHLSLFGEDLNGFISRAIVETMKRDRERIKQPETMEEIRESLNNWNSRK